MLSLEDREKCPTVRDYAAQLKVEPSTVRRWIAEGHFTVDRRKRPMRITGGERPLDAQTFLDRLRPLLGMARPGTFGQAEDGSIQLLLNGSIHEVPFNPHASRLPEAEQLLVSIIGA